MNGILLIDKPNGWTSFDVVAKVRGIIKHETGEKVKVGHTGTLDPLATGLLVLAVGKATKTIPGLTKLDKTYEVTMQLGKTSTTDDGEGEITDTNSSEVTDMEKFDAVLTSFLGESEQVPPIFSAIKVDGKRAYKLAREGKDVEMKSRPVRIDSIVDVEYAWPEVRFTVAVSSGTYIRSLVRDIGEKLGTGAYMSDLRRTTVGEFVLSDAIGMENIDFDAIESALKGVAV